MPWNVVVDFRGLGPFQMNGLHDPNGFEDPCTQSSEKYEFVLIGEHGGIFPHFRFEEVLFVDVPANVIPLF